MAGGTRVAVVTGANKGIGLTIVKELCSKFDGHVYLTSRNESLGLAAVSELEKLGLQPRYHQLDIDDELSVIRLRDYLKTNYGGLDVLVNNAATAFPPSSTKTFQEKAFIVLRTNFFNTHKTCEILFPILRDHARVVNVSSSAGHSSWMPGGTELKKKITSLDLTYEELCNLMQDYVESVEKGNHIEKGWPNRQFSEYSVSKIGLSALTRVQQRHFDRDPIRRDLIVNSVHPGIVETDMNRYFPATHTVEEGASAPSWLALLPPNIGEPKGEFIWFDNQIVDWTADTMPPQKPQLIKQ